MINDSDLTKKSKKTCEKISENMYILANEPSLACYRLQEHVRKSSPQLIDKMNEMKRVQKNLQGNAYDLDYSIGALKAMEGTEKHFQNIQELLKNSVFLKQQLDYDESVRMRVAANAGHSDSSASSANRKAFHRFSGSFDLPSSFIPASIASVSVSASADLKDLKSVITQMTTGASHGVSSASKRSRTASLSTPSTKHESEQQTSNQNDVKE